MCVCVCVSVSMGMPLTCVRMCTYACLCVCLPSSCVCASVCVWLSCLCVCMSTCVRVCVCVVCVCNCVVGNGGSKAGPSGVMAGCGFTRCQSQPQPTGSGRWFILLLAWGTLAHPTPCPPSMWQGHNCCQEDQRPHLSLETQMGNRGPPSAPMRTQPSDARCVAPQGSAACPRVGIWVPTSGVDSGG